MVKVVLFGSQKSLEVWHAEKRPEYQGWNITATRFWKPDGSEVRLILANYRGCEENLRGFQIDELEVFGPWSWELHQAQDHARCCLRPKSETAA